MYQKGEDTFVMGVLSGSHKGCLAQFPSIFANVAVNLEWIKENMIPKQKYAGKYHRRNFHKKNCTLNQT
jgi:hypothetical protein